MKRIFTTLVSIVVLQVAGFLASITNTSFWNRIVSKTMLLTNGLIQVRQCSHYKLGCKLFIFCLLITGSFTALSQTTYSSLEPQSSVDGHRFKKGQKMDFKYTYSHLADNEVPVTYSFFVVEIKDGQTKEEAMANNDTLFVHEYSSELPLEG